MNAEIRFAPPLRDWVLAHIDRGIPPAPLVRSMLEQGFDAQVAEALVHTLWSARACGAAVPAASILPHEVQAARYRREATRLAQGTRIATADREIRVALRHEAPTLAVLDDVLSAEECAALIALARPRLAPSTIVNPLTGNDVASASRSSDGMFFRPGVSALVARIDARLAQIMNLPQENGEACRCCITPPARQARRTSIS